MPRLAYILVALSIAAMLGGCGFRPLYSEKGGESVETLLRGAEVAPQRSRTGQLIRNAFLEGIPPAAAGGGGYRVNFRHSAKTLDAVVSFSGSKTHKRYVLNVDYSLSNAEGKELTNGKTFAEVSYTETGHTFSDDQARDNAIETAARVVARDMRTRLAAWLASHRQ